MQAEHETLVEVFRYPAGPEPFLPNWEGLAEGGRVASASAISSPPAASPSAAFEDGLRAQFERKIAEEAQRSFEAGRERGLLEGRQAEREAQAPAEMRRAGQLAELINGFVQERDRFFQKVEHEVVELALAVAARILRREAQMDPLLLTGAVRVALGQLSHTTEVRLLVPAAELELWTEAMAHVPNLSLKPTVVAGEGMRLGDCIIETELGSVDLGVRAQLGEIERGFFDRAGRSGAVAPPPVQATRERQP